MANLEKLDKMYEALEAIKDNKELYTSLRNELCAGNYQIGRVLDRYASSVKNLHNDVLCVFDIIAECDMDDFAHALDFWGVDEFVYFDRCCDTFKVIEGFINHGWSIAGAKEVLEHEPLFTPEQVKTNEDKTSKTYANGTVTGLKFVRA